MIGIDTIRFKIINIDKYRELEEVLYKHECVEMGNMMYVRSRNLVTTVEKKKEYKKTLKEDPDARVFVFNQQKEASLSRKSIMTKEETLKNKKGYKRVNSALNKEIKAKKRRDRKKLKTQDKLFNKYIKESKKRHKRIKKESKQNNN